MGGSHIEEFLNHSEGLFNVRIVCRDGVIVSHKIIVASVSNFIKNIMLNIPVGDDITLYLPEHHKIEIEEFLALNKSIKKEKDLFAETIDYDLEMDQRVSNELEHLKEEEEEIVHDGFETMNCNQIIPDLLKFDEKFKTDNSFDEIFTDQENSREENKLVLAQKKTTYEQALDYYKSDASITVRAAARKFNISHSKLNQMLKTGNSYKGRGCKSKVLTEEEEKIIVEKAVQRVHNGEALNSKILKQLIEDEIGILKEIYPERSSLQCKYGFVLTFAKRHGLQKFYPVSSKALSASSKINDTLSVRELKQNIQLNNSCEELAKDLIPNPTTEREKQKNSVIRSKIALEQALEFYKNDEKVSIRKAARKFNVSHTTLNTMAKTGKSYSGRGCKSKVFTEEEELIIVSRALEKVKSGHHFDLPVLWKIIQEEAEIIKINFPERNLEMKKSFTRTFAKRHALHKYFSEDLRERHYECDVCFKKFTFKNTLVKHQKSVHYSFLS